MFLHTNLEDVTKLSNFKHYREVLECLCEELSSKGVDQLYTMADTEKNAKFCESMGFDPVFEVLTYNDNQYEIMARSVN